MTRSNKKNKRQLLEGEEHMRERRGRNPGPDAAFARRVPYGLIDALGNVQVVRNRAEYDRIKNTEGQTK